MQTGVQPLGALNLHDSTINVEGYRFLLVGFQPLGGGIESTPDHSLPLP